ncbi:MAG: universal stress protein [Deltaproteobacteria bacterium]|nr:universal stress protein [Deltaproteobacteria bacterium]
MFNKILFATTGTPSCDAAARVAFDMAKRYSAELIIINVFGVPSRSFSQTVTDIRTGDEVDLHDDQLEKVKNELEKTYDQQIKSYTSCETIITVGIPHTEILRLARKKECDLIVMGARTSAEENENSVNRHVVGRTLQGVARSARCPVLAIGRAAASFWGGISNIVFGTDFSKASDEAFKFAFNLTKTFNGSLHLFHAIDISADPFEITKDQDGIEDQIREAREKIRSRYLSKMEGYSDYEIDVWEGIPYVEIVKYARESFADLIVMAHHTKKMDPEKAVLGSTVEQVVLRSNAPVISVNHPARQKKL